LNERVSQFLTLSRKDSSLEVESFSLQPLLKEITNFLYPTLLYADVILHEPTITDYLIDYLIKGVQSQIRQVLLNILINSIDALQMKDGERIISLEVVDIDDTSHIIIKNNGPIIPSNKIKSIFEPFVTTKKNGTGIGLFV